MIQNHAENHTTKWGHMEPLFLYVAFNAIHDTLSVPGSFEVKIEYFVFDLPKHVTKKRTSVVM